MEEREGTGWTTFAGVMILIAGVLNVIWGIGGSRVFVNGHLFIFSNLHAWGWIILIIGVIQIIAAFSIWAGGEFGRWIGVLGAGLSSIGALFTVPTLPIWSLCIFIVDVLILYGLLAYGGQARAPLGADREPPVAPERTHAP
jgi:hypothetical protein